MLIVVILKGYAYCLILLDGAIHAVSQRTVKSLVDDHRVVDILETGVLPNFGYLSHLGGNSPALVFAYNLVS